MSIQETREMIQKFKEDYENNDSLYYTNKTEYTNYINSTFTNIKEKYPAIITILLGKEFNESYFDRLDFMLNMAEKVENKDMVEHDASVAVGQRLVDDIVKPQLERNKQ